MSHSASKLSDLETQSLALQASSAALDGASKTALHDFTLAVMVPSDSDEALRSVDRMLDLQGDEFAPASGWEGDSGAVIAQAINTIRNDEAAKR